VNDTTAGLLQVGVLVAALALCYRPLGSYLSRVLTSERDLRVERAVYRVVGVDPRSDQRWQTYATSLLAFSGVGVLALYLLQRTQSHLPMSLGFGNVDPALAFNTAVSFVTNTNWQAYWASRRWARSCRCPASRCRTSSRRLSASASPSP
jgi:K+-transporting ATPase ATPase A chain